MPCGKKKKDKDNEVEMSKKAFRREHQKLVKVLRSGSPSKLKREARKQSKELRGK